MSDPRWLRVDEYVNQTIVVEDELLQAAVRESAAAGLPPIQVAPNQGKLLQTLAQSVGARRILEVGTLGGYSTIWLARALPASGELISLEISALHAQVARGNIMRAGLGERVKVIVGPAIESMSQLTAPFDFVFIDADKENIPAYFEQSIALARPGAVIVVDNVVRDGRLADGDTTDPAVLGVRRLHEMIARDDRVSATTIQTVGVKGYDGLLVARVH
ncbi:MAG: O-methyltransferase [Leptolyngbya sp. PLA3]|nr:MAG: O-methyltransferase [Cyanobacteria bacterium CYA]MCE7968295.1 O-methyltransferase [Leptolyngbya sp. PL-A3]